TATGPPHPLLEAAHLAHFQAPRKPTQKPAVKVKLGREMSPINYVGKSRHFASDIFSGLLHRDLSTGLFANLRQPTWSHLVAVHRKRQRGSKLIEYFFSGDGVPCAHYLFFPVKLPAAFLRAPCWPCRCQLSATPPRIFPA